MFYIHITVYICACILYILLVYIKTDNDINLLNVNCNNTCAQINFILDFSQSESREMNKFIGTHRDLY